MALLTLKLLAAAVFVITGGAVFSPWFKNRRILAVLASLVSLAGAYYLLKDVLGDMARQIRSEISAERPSQPAQPDAGSQVEFIPPAAESPPPDESPASGTERLTPAEPKGREGPPTEISPPTQIRPRVRRVFDALSIEGLSHSEQSPLVFPTAYFNRRLQQALGASSTQIPQIRLGVAFIEPRTSRASARDGTVIG